MKPAATAEHHFSFLTGNNSVSQVPVRLCQFSWGGGVVRGQPESTSGFLFGVYGHIYPVARNQPLTQPRVSQGKIPSAAERRSVWHESVGGCSYSVVHAYPKFGFDLRGVREICC